MTNQEAIRILSDLHDQCCQADSVFCTDVTGARCDAVDMAISALEKQVPKKPMKSIDRYNENLYKLNCPACGKYIACGNSRVRTLNKWAMAPDRCGYCGQRIAWGGDADDE